MPSVVEVIPPKKIETPKLRALIWASVQPQSAQTGGPVVRSAPNFGATPRTCSIESLAGPDPTPMDLAVARYGAAECSLMSGQYQDRVATQRAFDQAAVEIVKMGNDFPVGGPMTVAGITRQDILNGLVRRGIISRSEINHPGTHARMVVRQMPIQQLSAMGGSRTIRFAETPRSAVRRSLGLSV